MAHTEKESIQIRTPDELRELINAIPEGTIYSLKMEVIMTNEQDHGESE